MPLLLTVTDLDGAPIGSPGKPLPVRTPQQPQVTIPLSDARTGSMQVSMYESIAGDLGVATAYVKVLYVNPKGTNVLVLNGLIVNKSDDFDNETTTVSLHDATIRLKKRNLGYNHYSIFLTFGQAISDGNVNAFTGASFNGISSVYGIPLDGTGLRLMVMDASHGWKDWPGGGFSSNPPMGIRFKPGVTSVDNSTPQPFYGGGGVPPQGVVGFTATVTPGSPNLTAVNFSGATPVGSTIANILTHMRLDGAGIPEYASVLTASGTTIVMSENATGAGGTGVTITAEDAIYCQLSRGDCVYDDIIDIVQAAGSFECDWVPVDADHLGFSGGSWTAGETCELYTADHIGTDRSQGNLDGNTPVVFVHGLGGFHLTHAPDSDPLITYIVEVGPGGPADPLDILNKVTFEANTVSTYGIWESWEQAIAAGTGDNPISNALLTNRAAAKLTAYQNPPQFITATIDTDSIGKYAYGDDFFLGDTVTVYAKKGSVTVGPLAVRITSIGITQVDENGNCQLALTLVPYLTANPGISPNSL